MIKITKALYVLLSIIFVCHMIIFMFNKFDAYTQMQILKKFWPYYCFWLAGAVYMFYFENKGD